MLWPEARTRDHARLRERKTPESPSVIDPPKRSRRQPPKERIPSEWDSTDDERETVSRIKRKAHSSDEPTAALEHVLAERITRGRTDSEAAGEAPRTRTHTRTRADRSSRLPEKDRSNPVERAVGPVRCGDN